MTTQTLEESELLMKDSKYRVYVSAVDKALKNFEYTTEWADLIAALGKLNKVCNFLAQVNGFNCPENTCKIIILCALSF